MEISFTPSLDVAVVLNALLDILERRTSHSTQHETRSIKVTLADLPLPSYFSQANPEPRITANEQLIHLEKSGLIKLTWIPGETGHLLQSITIPKTEHALPNSLFHLANRTPIADNRTRLESHLLADKPLIRHTHGTGNHGTGGSAALCKRAEALQ